VHSLGAMRPASFAAFVAARDEFRGLVEAWTARHGYLGALLERLRAESGYEDYRVETPIVYNRALDDVTRGDDIRIVLVADNPGKNEQLERNRRYLVGQSGKIAEGWFRRELGLDFRRQVAILNKTPVHTPKTAELRKLIALAAREDAPLAGLLAESQRAMAGIAARLHARLREREGSVLWISGRGELRRGGLFESYRDELAPRLAAMPPASRDRVWVFSHFSMNQFAIELKRKSDPRLGLEENLARIGTGNREAVFGG
jgi:hypothetical protein